MRAASTSTIPTRCRSVAAHPGGQHLASQEKKEVTRMSRASDEGVHHEPGHLAQAGPQDTGDAGHGTRTRLPGTCDQPGPGCSAASEPVTDVLALRPWPGTQARLVVTACGDGPGTVFEGLPAGGWALAGGDVVLDIAWRDGPGSHPGTDVAIRQMAGGDLVVVAAWEGLRSSWPERARPAVAAVMNLYSALELAGGEIYLRPPGQWPQPAATPPARPQPQTTTARSPAITSGVLAPPQQRRDLHRDRLARRRPANSRRPRSRHCLRRRRSRQRDLWQQRVAGLAARRRRIPGQPPPAAADPLPTPVQPQDPLTPTRRTAPQRRQGSGQSP